MDLIKVQAPYPRKRQDPLNTPTPWSHFILSSLSLKGPHIITRPLLYISTVSDGSGGPTTHKNAQGVVCNFKEFMSQPDPLPLEIYHQGKVLYKRRYLPLQPHLPQGPHDYSLRNAELLLSIPLLHVSMLCPHHSFCWNVLPSFTHLSRLSSSFSSGKPPVDLQFGLRDAPSTA